MGENMRITEKEKNPSNGVECSKSHLFGFWTLIKKWGLGKWSKCTINTPDFNPADARYKLDLIWSSLSSRYYSWSIISHEAIDGCIGEIFFIYIYFLCRIFLPIFM